jgi:hypothetical protein
LNHASSAAKTKSHLGAALFPSMGLEIEYGSIPIFRYDSETHDVVPVEEKSGDQQERALVTEGLSPSLF